MTVFIPTLDAPYSVDSSTSAPDEYMVLRNNSYIGGFETEDNGRTFWVNGADGLDDFLGTRPTAGEAIDLIINTYLGK